MMTVVFSSSFLPIILLIVDVVVVSPNKKELGSRFWVLRVFCTFKSGFCLHGCLRTYFVWDNSSVFGGTKGIRSQLSLCGRRLGLTELDMLFGVRTRFLGRDG